MCDEVCEMTLTINQGEALWTQKYRPNNIDECILSAKTKAIFKGFLEKGDIPNLILASPAGHGKTMSARAICNQLGYDVMFINASLENGIDILRNKIQNFASSISLSGSKHCVILDEADYLSPAAQPALRSFMESFSKNTRFILTCNYPNRLIEPLHSRCTLINFDVDPAEREDLVKQTLRRVFAILKNENVQFEPKAAALVVNRHYPDIRRALNELQRYSANGSITCNVINEAITDNFDDLVNALKTQNFREMRQWVAMNKDTAGEKIFTYFYNNAHKFMKPDSIPQLVLTSAEYQYKAAFAADQEINIAAYLTELMANCQFL